MADPLSVTAGIIAVLGAIESVTKTLARIKSIRNAPNELLALINEVSDLKLILSDVQSYLADCTASQQLPREPLQHMSTLANRARDRLLELDELIQYRFTKADSTTDQIKVSRREWARARSTIETFRQSLRDIRLNIVTQMVVVNSCVSILFKIHPRIVLTLFRAHQSRIGLTIDEICIISSQLQMNHHLSGERITRQLDEHSRLLTHILTGQPDLQGQPQLRTSSDGQAQISAGGLVATTSDQSSGSIIRIRAHATQTSRLPCYPRCVCACHNIRSFSSPLLLHKTIGTLFIGYSGCPLRSLHRCTDSNCLSQSTFRAYVHYHFPYWFVTKALTVALMSVYLDKISVSLTVRNVVSPGAEIFRLAYANDVDGLRGLFSVGSAAPNDSSSTGVTALIVCCFLNSIGVSEFIKIV